MTGLPPARAMKRDETSSASCGVSLPPSPLTPSTTNPASMPEIEVSQAVDACEIDRAPVIERCLGNDDTAEDCSAFAGLFLLIAACWLKSDGFINSAPSFPGSYARCHFSPSQIRYPPIQNSHHCRRDQDSRICWFLLNKWDQMNNCDRSCTACPNFEGAECPKQHVEPVGRMLVDQLIAQGVDRLTYVPGESYLAVLDALHDASIDVLVCRNEGGAAMMGRLWQADRAPGICFVTRGPGATNASPGVHIASQDSTPMILFIGQVARHMRERGRRFRRSITSSSSAAWPEWVVEVDDPSRLPELIARAFGSPCRAGQAQSSWHCPRMSLSRQAEVADAARVDPVEIWPGPPHRRSSMHWCRRQGPAHIAGRLALDRRGAA